MKSVSDNLIALAVILIMAVSPLQGVSAAMSDCDMMSDMTMSQHHNMNNSIKADHHSASLQIHCNDHDCVQDKCGADHCATASTVMPQYLNNTSVPFNTAGYALNQDSTIHPRFSFPLFRPPKA